MARPTKHKGGTKLVAVRLPAYLAEFVDQHGGNTVCIVKALERYYRSVRKIERTKEAGNG